MDHLIQKRIKKYKSKLPEWYLSETSWAIRTNPPKKRPKENPGIPLPLFKIIFEKDDVSNSQPEEKNKSLLALFDQYLNEDKEDNESDHDPPIFDEIDEENDEKAKDDVKKSILALEDVNEDEEDDDPDGWGEYINRLRNEKKPPIYDEIDEENDEKAKDNNEKQKDVPTRRQKVAAQKVPYLLSDLCKPKNPTTSKLMEKPFKGVAYW